MCVQAGWIVAFHDFDRKRRAPASNKLAANNNNPANAEQARHGQPFPQAAAEVKSVTETV